MLKGKGSSKGTRLGGKARVITSSSAAAPSLAGQNLLVRVLAEQFTVGTTSLLMFAAVRAYCYGGCLHCSHQRATTWHHRADWFFGIHKAPNFRSRITGTLASSCTLAVEQATAFL